MQRFGNVSAMTTNGDLRPGARTERRWRAGADKRVCERHAGVVFAGLFGRYRGSRDGGYCRDGRDCEWQSLLSPFGPSIIAASRATTSSARLSEFMTVATTPRRLFPGQQEARWRCRSR